MIIGSRTHINISSVVMRCICSNHSIIRIMRMVISRIVTCRGLITSSGIGRTTISNRRIINRGISSCLVMFVRVSPLLLFKVYVVSVVFVLLLVIIVWFVLYIMIVVILLLLLVFLLVLVLIILVV